MTLQTAAQTAVLVIIKDAGSKSARQTFTSDINAPIVDTGSSQASPNNRPQNSDKLPSFPECNRRDCPAMETGCALFYPCVSIHKPIHKKQ